MMDSPSTEFGVQFIKDYQNGRYGYGVRGETKAFMYRQSLECKSEKQIRGLLNTMSDCWVGGFNDEQCSQSAWVLQDGTVIYCDIGIHDAVARKVLFTTVRELELVAARITLTTKCCDDALEYVTKPTNLQIRAVENIMEKTNRY